MTVATAALLHLVRNEVLAFPERREWSLQGFGMLRTYLGPEMRLHVWDPVYRVRDVSDIHDHPWHFESMVLSGQVENRRYEYSFVEPSSHHAGEILCGPKPERHGPENVQDVRLICFDTKVHKRGERYAMLANELHSSHPSPGAVTVIQKSNAYKDLNKATVYWPLGTSWVSAEPRPATVDEVRRITQGALERWENA